MVNLYQLVLIKELYSKYEVINERWEKGKKKKKVIHPWGYGIPLFIGKEDDLGIQNPYVILYQTGVSEILTILIMNSLVSNDPCCISKMIWCPLFLYIKIKYSSYFILWFSLPKEEVH